MCSFLYIYIKVRFKCFPWQESSMRGLIYVLAKWPVSQYYSRSLLRTKHEFYPVLFLRRRVKEHPIRNSLVHYYLCCNDTSHSAGAKELHLGTCPRRCVTPFQLHRGDWNLKNPVCDLIFPPSFALQSNIPFFPFLLIHTLAHSPPSAPLCDASVKAKRAPVCVTSCRT